MKKIVTLLAFAALFLVSCDTKPTLQKYLVEKSETKDFVALDISPSFIKTDSLKLTPEEQTALKSLHNLNILAFKANATNAPVYEKELAKVKKLLKDDSYEELIKFNHDGMGASVSTKGEGEHIEEFVVLANQDTNGFGIVRVTGKDMTPTNVMTIVSLLQKANLDLDQLKPIQAMLEKK